jgi:glycosyltransferase involved in cell wall biosynthesis
MSGPARPLGRPDEPLEPVRGVRVVLDARPLQEPDRAPTTAAYLDGLLSAFDAAPLDGESFALFLQSDLGDPTSRFERLSVVGRRLLPPTRLLRSAALTVDPFLLRGAALGAAWRADRAGAAGAVYHAAGGSALPLALGLPVVVTLLDLAPWEMPGAFQRTPATRFGQRIRGRLLHDADALIVGTEAVRDAARRLLRVRRDRIRVIPFAPRDAFTPEGPDGADERGRLGLPERYLVYAGRYDARQDLATLLRALAALASDGRPGELPEDVPWPPRILLVGASPDDRAALARAAAREGVGEALAYAPRLPDARLAALVRGARAAILPVLSEAAGFAAIDALASGTPVVASAVGALPELVGSAGILVPPREPERLATALHTAWVDERVHAQIAREARLRAAERRTWAEVADATRRVYAEVGAFD